MAENKIISYDVELLSTNKRREFYVPEIYTNDLYTNEFQFNIIDMTATELSGATASILLDMKDGSFFNNADVTRSGNVFKYILKENEGNHFGIAEVQLVVVIGGKDYATPLYNFAVMQGLDDKKANEVVINDLNSETRKEIAKLKKETNATISDLSTQWQQVIDETTGKDIVSAPEIIAARGTHENLSKRLNSQDQQLTETSDNFQLKKENEESDLGEELLTGSGWVSEGWTGSFNAGFLNGNGNTKELTYPLNAKIGGIYLIEMTVHDSDVMNSGFNFNVYIGNSDNFEMYQGTGGTITYSKAIKATTGGQLRIVPKSNFTGKIYNMSVKEVAGFISPTMKIKDEGGESVFEIRPSQKEQVNVFVGKEAGRKNISGYGNTIVGDNAMGESVSGFWNSALGERALKNNVNGSRSIAIGARSLEEMVSGHRNIAVGTFSLHRVTSGHNNIGIGADTAWYTTTGSYNIAIGTVSLDKNETGTGNIAIGYNALRDNLSTSYNVAIGHWALRNSTQHNNVAVGSKALEANTTGSGQVAVGYESLRNLISGNNNTAIGQWAGSEITNGRDNILIGRMPSSNMEKGNGNILIGNSLDVGLEQNNTLNIGNLIFGGILNKKVGLGIKDPKANLHILGGSSGTPALMIDAGTLLSYPANYKGAFEYDGMDLYFIKGNGIRVNLTGGA